MSNDLPLDSLPSFLLLLVPLALTYAPTIYRILSTTSLVKQLLRVIKITQFSYRLFPYLLSKTTYLDLVHNFLLESWLRWKSRTWLWLGGRLLKEVTRLAGFPQELFDVVEECVWGGWCMGLDKGVDHAYWPTKTVPANATEVVEKVVEALVVR